jgi:hypothetical protein
MIPSTQAGSDPGGAEGTLGTKRFAGVTTDALNCLAPIKG